MEANQTQTAAFANLSLSAETITELQTMHYGSHYWLWYLISQL